MMGKSLNYAYPRKFAEGGEVPSGVEVPEGFEFAGMVDTKYKGPAASFTKQGDDTGFTVYAAEVEYGPNKGKTGYFFDDIGEEVGSANTGGYLNAEDAFNQGRTRSGNYVYHYNTLIDRGVKLDDAAMEQLNAALAHHDKYLGGVAGFDRRRDNLINTMNAVQGYENYTGQTYTIGDKGAKLMPSEPAGPVFGGTITDDNVPIQDTGAPISDMGEVTTMAVGEEDGGGNLPKDVMDQITTMAVGEEDGGGGFIKDDSDPVYTTMAIGEEDGPPPPASGPVFGGTITDDNVPIEDTGGPIAIDPFMGGSPEVITTAIGEEGNGGGGFNPIDTLPQPDPVAPIEPFPGARPDNPFLNLPVPFDPPIADLPVNPPTTPPIATTTAFGEEDGGMQTPVEQPRTYGEIPPTVQPVGRTYGNTNPFTGETMFNQMYQPVAVDASQALDPLREGLGSFLPGGAGNYANNPFMRRT